MKTLMKLCEHNLYDYKIFKITTNLIQNYIFRFI